MDCHDCAPPAPVLKTKRQRLQELDDAISAVAVGGQKYAIGNRSLERANLSELQKARKALQDEIETEEGTDGLLCGAYVAYMEPR